MKILLCIQADHLQHSVRRSVQQAAPAATVVFSDQLPSRLDDFSQFSRFIWLAGALPQDKWLAAATLVAACPVPMLVFGTGALVLAQFWGATVEQIASSTDIPTAQRIQQINAPDSVLRYLPRQIEAVPILQPQFAITRLPNSLSALAKNDAGHIVAWKHRTRSVQAVLAHPLQGDWAQGSAKIWG